MESVLSAEKIAFGPFCLTPAARLLTRNGEAVDIGGRSLDLLTALLEQPGRMVSRQELLKRVWPDVIVEDGSLRFHMASLRKALRDGKDGARYIATQVGVGYAFVAPVRMLDASGAVAVAAADPPAPEAGPSCNLPPRSQRVIGRDRDVALLRDRLAQTPLFTIVGPAGVGKTTVAVETAHASGAQFADGAYFVDLGTLEDAALVPSAIAGALAIAIQAADPTGIVVAHLRTQQLLLVLDNCEHVIASVSAFVERVLAAAPRVCILATSREPLRVRGEHVHWLGSLDYPPAGAELSLEQLLAYPAVELFIERATAGNSALDIDVDAARTIGDLCRRLDGMALPIELTAVRVASHGLPATSALLGERFSLGWTGHRTAVPRQQTLQATLDWSYDLLSDTERRTLERLGVFLGPFTLDAALDVVADARIDSESTVASLDELTSKSLVAPDRTAGVGSYRLLEMTRAYARKKLAARGDDELQATARRHATFYLRELESIGPPERTFLMDTSHFAQMLGNIRSALEWGFGPHGDLLLAVRLAAASARVFLTLSLLFECRGWCERAIAHLDGHYPDTSVELELQAALGFSLMFTRGNTEAVEVALRRALDIATTIGDRCHQLRLLGRLHIFHERIGDFATAVAWAERAMAVAGAIGDQEAVAIATSLAGVSHHLEGDQTQARRELELSLRQSLPSERGRTVHYGFDHRNRSGIALARTLWLQGYADQARHVAQQTVEEASAALAHPVTHCIALIWAFSVHVWRGDLDDAQACLDTFAKVAEVNAFEPYIAAAGGFAGLLAVQRGHGDLRALAESLGRLRLARYELLTSTFELALGQALILERRHADALALLDETIARCNANGERYTLPELVRVKARAAHAIDGAAAAERLLQEALACSRQQGARAWELRAAIDLARLRAEAGSAAEALALLRPVRDALSEGVDTADMQAADALLRTLASAAASPL